MNYFVSKSDPDGNLIPGIECEVQLQMFKVKSKDYFALVFNKSGGHTQVFLDHFNAIKSKCAGICFSYHA
jgi:hypothetical protein